VQEGRVVLLQDALTKSNKADLLIDLAELVSGLLLVGFLWIHVLFVSTVIIDPDIFNNEAKFLEKYLLAQIGIPIVILLIILHMILAGRRLPSRFSDMRIVWKHSRLLNHYDTWTWLFQCITGVAIGILATAHIWTVVTEWDITVEISSRRVIQSPYFIFYIILILAGLYHAGVGLYREAVKWGWIERKKVAWVLNAITICIITIGIVGLFVLKGYAVISGGGVVQ